MTYQQWLIYAYTRLANTEDAKQVAKILLAYVTKKSRAYILAFNETWLTKEQVITLNLMLERRENGEPVAYILGEREFWSLPISVSPATLIPRPDTECLVEQALSVLSKGEQRVLDLGTGTGAIALALASERPDCFIVGVDSQEAAVELAQRNAKKLQLNNTFFLRSNWYDALQVQRFTLIVSNPPYIDEQDPHLKQGDVRYEPKSALIAADSGLADIKHIINEGKKYLIADGWLLIEHGWQQGDHVRTIFEHAGFSYVKTCNDYGGNERITLGQYAKLS